jgi:hypothetical protein
MTEPKLRDLIFSLEKKGYKVFSKPYELNIVGIRSSASKQNSFDDLICVFYKDDKGEWQYKCYPATTDPGTYYLNNPMSNLGTAALKAGQYIDSHQQGLHKGQYKALTQAKPVTVYRDLDRNAIFDFGTKTTSGLYGINIHKAGLNSEVVNNWSAGCQVFKKSADYNEFMALTDKHKEKNGNKFTYTLLDEREDLKKKRRYLVYILVSGAVVLTALQLRRLFLAAE